jgi:hypothetical protein
MLKCSQCAERYSLICRSRRLQDGYQSTVSMQYGQSHSMTSHSACCSCALRFFATAWEVNNSRSTLPLCCAYSHTASCFSSREIVTGGASFSHPSLTLVKSAPTGGAIVGRRCWYTCVRGLIVVGGGTADVMTWGKRRRPSVGQSTDHFLELWGRKQTCKDMLIGGNMKLIGRDMISWNLICTTTLAQTLEGAVHKIVTPPSYHLYI